MMKNFQTYGIGDAAKITGVTQQQIRNWEAKGYIPVADRTVLGKRSYRRFTVEQVELISKIRSFLDQGFSLYAAAERAKKESMPGGSE